MSEDTHEIRGYRVTLATCNSFFGAWLQRNLFTRRRLMITLVLSAVMLAAPVWALKDYGYPSLHLSQTEHALTFALTISVLFLAFVVIAAIGAYIITPLITYFVLITIFWFGPARNRISDVVMSAEEITKRTDKNVYSTQWTRIFEVVSTKTSILLFTNRNCALMIPKSAFPTPESERAFYLAAQNWWIRANR